MTGGPRRVPALWHPEEGPIEEWLAAWAREGMVPEYPWSHGPPDQEPAIVNGRQAWPVALIEKAWLDLHPGYVESLRSEGPSDPSPSDRT